MGESMITSFDGTKLYLKKETAADNKAVIVIVHGLCEHQGRYDYFAEKLHEAGIGTYRFDHRGHGRSEGEETFYSDFNELLDDTNVVVDMAIEENPDVPVFLLGHSMGGFTVSLYVHTRLANQLGSGVCSVQEVVDWYGKDPYNKQSFTAGLCYAICDGLDWFKEKKAEFHYPVLMTHGEKDGLVSVQDTYDFFREAGSKDKQMKIYGGLFHEILNEYCKDEVIGDMIRWMEVRI